MKVPELAMGVLTLMITASLVPGRMPRMRGMLAAPATVVIPGQKRYDPIWLVWLKRCMLDPERTSTPVVVLEELEAL